MGKKKKSVRIKEDVRTICSVKECMEWAEAITGVLVPLCPTHLRIKRELNARKHPTLFKEDK
jgi:hypothetical protein